MCIHTNTHTSIVYPSLDRIKQIKIRRENKLNKKKIIEYIIAGISYIIMLLSTTFLPDLIGDHFLTSIEKKEIGIIVGTSLLIIFILIKYILDRSIDKSSDNTNHVENPDELSTKSDIDSSETDKDKIFKLTHIHTFRLYAISSAYWVDLISSMENIYIDQCTILIRKVNNFTTKKYEEEVNLSIEKWRRLKDQGKITRLEILEYQHIPDIYYAIFDQTAVVTGLNYFDSLDSTGQHGQRDSLYIFADTTEKTKIVNSYIAQFENYIQTIKEPNLNFQKQINN